MSDKIVYLCTEGDLEVIERFKKPVLTFSGIEQYFISKGLNPFAPWMKEDHERVNKILMKNRLKIVR